MKVQRINSISTPIKITPDGNFEVLTNQYAGKGDILAQFHASGHFITDFGQLPASLYPYLQIVGINTEPESDVKVPYLGINLIHHIPEDKLSSIPLNLSGVLDMYSAGFESCKSVLPLEPGISVYLLGAEGQLPSIVIADENLGGPSQTPEFVISEVTSAFDTPSITLDREGIAAITK